MRSSAASPPSPRGAPRCCRGSSFFMPPVPPVILYASNSVRRGPALAGAVRATVLEPRDRCHHLSAGNLVVPLAIGSALGLKSERLAERHRHLRRPRQASAPGPRPPGSSHIHGND